MVPLPHAAAGRTPRQCALHCQKPVSQVSETTVIPPSVTIILMSRSPRRLAQTFTSLVDQGAEDERIDLVRAALTIAQTEYRQLNQESYCTLIKELAHRVKRLVPDIGDPSESMEALN